MILKHKILFWFRDNLSIQSNYALQQSLSNGSEIIPVFCFDAREILIAEEVGQKELFANQLVSKVISLRENLQAQGSNLLVVNNYYEVIIPSLARVLNADQVMSDIPVNLSNTLSDKITNFRNSKLLEVKRLLKMHSIPFFADALVGGVDAAPHFSSFPEINPGQVPNVSQLLEQQFCKTRSIAC